MTVGFTKRTYISGNLGSALSATEPFPLGVSCDHSNTGQGTARREQRIAGVERILLQTSNVSPSADWLEHLAASTWPEKLGAFWLFEGPGNEHIMLRRPPGHQRRLQRTHSEVMGLQLGQRYWFVSD